MKQYESLDASPPWSRTWWTRSPRKSAPLGKNPLVRGEPSAVELGVKLGHPRSHSVGVEYIVPRRIQGVRNIDSSPVAADLHHLWPSGKLRRPAGPGEAPGEQSRRDALRLSFLPRVERVAHVVLLKLAGPPARDVQPAVVDGQVDIGD